jgi:glycosyltransferase involved in cell wall biosynthesis
VNANEVSSKSGYPVTNKSTNIPRVSVVIPCYNASSTIETALGSISQQSYRPLEMIVVDDGSTDSSLQVLRKLSEDEPRLRIISRKHEGIIPSLNAGIDASTAPYIARMDADDLAHPDRIIKQATYLDSHPDVAVVGCLVEGIPIEEIGEGFKLYLKWVNGLITHEEIVREIFIESPLVHPSVMIRREWLDRVGGYEDHGWAEDYDLWLRLYLAGARFEKVPELLLEWRERPDRLTWTDERYSRENFTRAKSHYLCLGPIKGKDAVIVWGAGQTGKRISKYLFNEGVPIAAFIDIDPKKVGRQRRVLPILSPDKLPELWGRFQNPVLLAAVAARDARELIREHLNSIGLIEGVDWWAVA